MNKAKKTVKNQGLGTEKKGKQQTGSAGASKNLVLLGIGIAIVLVLCLGVCYIQLRPRPVLKVEGKTASGTAVSSSVSYKESMYDIYTTENQYNSMESLYTQYYGSTFWEAQNLDEAGRNGAQLAKKEIMSGLKQREILSLEAKSAGVTLSDEEKNKVSEDLKTFRDGLSKKQKKMDGLDEKTVRKVLEKQALADKYKEQLIAGLGIDEEALKATVSKEDYRQYTLQYYTISKLDESADGTDSEKSTAKKKSDEELKKEKADMEALRQKAASAEDFSKGVITDENNDNKDDETGISYDTRDLLETDTDFMSKKARKKVKALENGEVSEVIQTSDAYYVVKMVNNNDTSAYDEQCESVINEEKETQFNKKYKEDIKPNYTAKAQTYWKKRVTIGYITYDEQALASE